MNFNNLLIKNQRASLGDGVLIKFIQMKDPALFQGEIITKKQEYIDEL